MLPFHLCEFVDRDVLQLAVNVDHNGNGDGTFGSCNSNGKNGKEQALMSGRVEQTIEDRKIDVGSVEHQFNAQ